MVENVGELIDKLFREGAGGGSPKQHTRMFMRLDAAGGIPEPPAGYVSPLGASRNTWTNIYKNKGRIDYCVQQFAFLGNRLKCIDKLTGGPFLE